MGTTRLLDDASCCLEETGEQSMFISELGLMGLPGAIPEEQETTDYEVDTTLQSEDVEVRASRVAVLASGRCRGRAGRSCSPVVHGATPVCAISGRRSHSEKPRCSLSLGWHMRKAVARNEVEQLPTCPSTGSDDAIVGDCAAGERHSADHFFGKCPASRISSERSPMTKVSPEVLFPTHRAQGKIFDDYDLFDTIGHGSFGEVKVVRQKHTRQVRACKVVTVRRTAQLQLIETEMKLLKSLNHPNIVNMHEVYFEQSSWMGRRAAKMYLVQELCEGGDVASRITFHYDPRRRRPISEGLVASMMQQILSATQYCHDLGIVHRDIKPENLLFVDMRPGSTLKIIDFGLADFIDRLREGAREVEVPRSGPLGKLARSLPKLGKRRALSHVRKKVMQLAGTPHYMAPEMDKGVYDQKADMFSIGIVLCQLLTGVHPFYQRGVDDAKTVRMKIVAPDPVSLPEDHFSALSWEAGDLCRALLEKRPKRRLSAAQALAHPWFQDPEKPLPFGSPLKDRLSPPGSGSTAEGSASDTTWAESTSSACSTSTFDRLRAYQACHKLKRLALQLLAHELSEPQVKELRSRFMALNTRGDGSLSVEELAAGMRQAGYEMSMEELEHIVAALGGAESGRIGYAEFIAALVEQEVDFGEQDLRRCFQKLDIRSTGCIAYEDIRDALSSSDSSRPGITESEWEEIAMPGGSGGMRDRLELTFERFATLVRSQTGGR